MEKSHAKSPTKPLAHGGAIGRRAFFGGVAATTLAAASAAPGMAAPKEWKVKKNRPAGTSQLVWSEDFTGNSLYEGMWEYELGNIRGNEQQHYSRSPENLKVANGQLTITATDRPLVDQYRNTAKHGTRARLVKYNSASIRTHGKKNFLYGKLEVRAKLPQGKGAFPAIWLLGHDFHLDGRISTAQGTGWPSCGELDMVELIGSPTALRAAGGEVGGATNSNKKVYGTPHFAYSLGDADGDGSYSPYSLGGTSTIATNFADDFHVFGINRTPEKLEWLLDGVVYKTVLYTDPDPQENARRQAMAAGMNRPMYLQINLATGGNWAGDAGDFLGADGTSLVVDWIQYSQTAEQRSADIAYFAQLPVMSGIRDMTMTQGQGPNLAAHISVNKPGYEVVWSVEDTPQFVNTGAPGGRNEVRLRASSTAGLQSLKDLPAGNYRLYYTALPTGTDLSSSSKTIPTVKSARGRALLKVLPGN